MVKMLPPDLSLETQKAVMKEHQRHLDPYLAAKTASHWHLDCQRASQMGRLCSMGSYLAVSWAHLTSLAMLRAEMMVSLTQMVIQTA